MGPRGRLDDRKGLRGKQKDYEEAGWDWKGGRMGLKGRQDRIEREAG